MLAACTTSQAPYAVGNFSTTGVTAFVGDSPGSACQAFIASNAGLKLTAAMGHSCQYSESSVSYTRVIAKVCDNTPGFTPDKIADMSLLWALFLVCAIVIWCLRRLLNVFDSPPHGE
jgi:hypothetical protein